jgi:hypothetical protein
MKSVSSSGVAHGRVVPQQGERHQSPTSSTSSPPASSNPSKPAAPFVPSPPIAAPSSTTSQKIRNIFFRGSSDDPSMQGVNGGSQPADTAVKTGSSPSSAGKESAKDAALPASDSASAVTAELILQNAALFANSGLVLCPNLDAVLYRARFVHLFKQPSR